MRSLALPVVFARKHFTLGERTARPILQVVKILNSHSFYLLLAKREPKRRRWPCAVSVKASMMIGEQASFTSNVPIRSGGVVVIAST